MILDQAVERLATLLHERGLNPHRSVVTEMVKAHVNATSRALNITARAAMQHLSDLTLVPLADSIALATGTVDEMDLTLTQSVPLSTAAELSTSLMCIATARAHRAHPADTPAITDALNTASTYQHRIREAATAYAVEEITMTAQCLDRTAALIEAAAHQDDLLVAPGTPDPDRTREHLLAEAQTARALALAARP